MTYFPDLAPYEGYTTTERRFCGLPTLLVGWLDQPYPIPTGPVPAGFAQRLFAFCTWDKLLNCTGGHHDCAYCNVTYSQHLERVNSPLGNGEIRVLGDGVAYAAPSLVCHYVTAHDYLPPPDFVAAVMEGPSADDRALRLYRFHYWEAQIADAVRGTRWIGRDGQRMLPPERPGGILGPLIWGYRGLAAVFILFAAIGLVHPGGILVTGPIVLALGAMGWLLRGRLTCPVCRKRLALVLREPTGWSLPPDGPWATMYCTDCGLGFRPTTDLLGPPICEVATKWR